MESILNYMGETVQKYGNRWFKKKIVIFGDSRTWYDGNAYTANTKSEWTGKICKGYQQTIEKQTGAVITNQGVSGESSAQITARVRNFNFASYDAVILAGGVNDKFFKNMEDGELMPIGSTFDTTTIYGAWQSAVEYILNNYPNIMMYLTIPPIAWNGSSIYEYDTAKIKGEVAELYNLPYMDLYSSLGINVQNRDYYYADDITKTNWRIHFNDIGNELIGHVISGMLLSTSANKTLSTVKETSDEIADIREQIENIEPGLSNEAKEALLACFEHVAWVDEHGQDYYDALEAALNRGVRYPILTANFNSYGKEIYIGNTLSDIKKYLTVTCYTSADDPGTTVLTPFPVTGNNQYINLSGSTVDINNPSTSSGIRYSLVECHDDDVYVINADCTGPVGARIWGFIDANGNILSVAEASLDYVRNLRLTPPSGASYLIVNYIGESTSYNDKYGVSLSGQLNVGVNSVLVNYSNRTVSFLVNIVNYRYTRWSTNPPDNTYGRIIINANSVISEKNPAPNTPIAQNNNTRSAIFTSKEYSDYKIEEYGDIESVSLYAIPLPLGTTGFTATFSNSSGTCLYVFKKDDNGIYQVVRDYISWYTNQEVITNLDPDSLYIICGGSMYNNSNLAITIEVETNGNI